MACSRVLWFSLFRYALIGLFATVVVAQGLGLVWNLSESLPWHPEGPEVPEHLHDPNYRLRAEAIVGLGLERRLWSYKHAYRGMEPPGGMFGAEWNRSSAWWEYCRRDGPMLAWSVGGQGGWGDMYRTDALTTTEAWRSFGGLEEARGFPALCLWHEVHTEERVRPGSVWSDTIYTTPGGWQLPQPQGVPANALNVRAIAWRPIWLGLIVNTIFWGGLAWLLVRLRSLLRGYRRMMRGLCVECRYDLRRDYSRGCPECGWGKA